MERPHRSEAELSGLRRALLACVPQVASGPFTMLAGAATMPPSSETGLWPYQSNHLSRYDASFTA
jgi:hypothetical protein